jgi:hypothetical protein
MRTFGGTFWELTLLPSWQGRPDPECESIGRPDGAGALQISAATKDGEVTDEDLLDFAREQVIAGATQRPVEMGPFLGIALTYVLNKSHWRRWFLRHGRVALFVTYNCALADNGTDDDDVDRMLSSLRTRASAL